MLELKDGRFFELHTRPQGVAQKVVGRIWSFSRHFPAQNSWN